jgi:HK97 family phage prohead protease
MREFETKNYSFEVKATGENEFEGYASVFGNADAHDDIMIQGAFKKTLDESKRVKVLWQHDPWQVIGKPTAMSEDSKGLHVKAKISNTTLGRDVVQLLKDGVIDELSIGFNTIKDEFDNKTGKRYIKEVKLWEFSPVTFAANELAGITGVKSIDIAPHLTKMHEWINGEFKAGKVLSDKNKNLVQSAIDALTALLSTTEKSMEPPTGTQKPTEDEQKAADDILLMLKSMQDFSEK